MVIIKIRILIKDRLFEYNFTFILEEGIDFPVGPLNPAALAAVQTHVSFTDKRYFLVHKYFDYQIRSLLAASNSDILHNGELKLLAASIESLNRSTRKKRAIRDSLAVMANNGNSQNARQVLHITISFQFFGIIILNLGQIILGALTNIYFVIPLPVPIRK